MGSITENRVWSYLSHADDQMGTNLWFDPTAYGDSVGTVPALAD